ncbi:ell-associated factor 1 [Phtheirospermum japonicum]|uniref:Ell-associated factor 1 n=1 Tax=Phtheirospermum japonicum TaxID=374723 RepID=A0A830D308_9LAMI|nr:ell-associated factor 1 [Phtheirospermum japonicum]
MAGINNTNEPSTAPQADRWYNLTLGSSFKDHNPSKFRTFRYEFKPASIDKNQRGMLHKSKDNKVTVEFQNIQPGKPKMIFEGTSEDYKDNDAVLFFDGESFRLERLHRAVKRLRHNRTLSESAGAVAASAGPSDPSSPPVGKGVKHQPVIKEAFQPAPVEVERIEIGDFKSSDAKPRPDKTVEYPAAQSNSSPDPKNNNDDDDLDEPLDIMNDDDDDLVGQLDIMNDDDEDDNNNNININNNNMTAGDEGTIEVNEVEFDMNKPHPADTDDEIADVDVSDDEADKGPNAAEALRAQVIAQEGKGESSSSSGSSSESSGSGSGSGSSSSDSESSDADSD